MTDFHDTGEEEELGQGNTGSEEEVAANRPVETGESDTGNRTEPGTEEEQEEPGRSGEEAPAPQNQEEPEQQPIQPDVGEEAGKERGVEEEAPLDTFERSLLDILEEDSGRMWVRSARHFPTGVPCVRRSEEEGQVERRSQI